MPLTLVKKRVKFENGQYRTVSEAVHLTERIEAGGAVDRTGGRITGIKVISRISRNGREYSEAALDDVARLAENAPVFVDHPEHRKAGGQRSIRDKIGHLTDVRRTSDGVRGDFVFLKSHPLSEQICESAERMPHQLGMSIN